MGAEWGRRGRGMAVGCPPAGDVLCGYSQVSGGCHWDRTEEPRDDAGRGPCACWAASGCCPPSLKGVSRFRSSLHRVVVADPVPKTGRSVPHHRQHPDERAELPVPCHLHHSPVPDESVHAPGAGEMCSCLTAGLFLDLTPRQCVRRSLGNERGFEVLQREAGLCLSSLQPEPALTFNGS